MNISNKTQTGIEFLYQELENILDLYPSEWDKIDKATERAKEIEKQQEQDKKLYTEEEVLKIITSCKKYLSFGDEFNEHEWFEEFKK